MHDFSFDELSYSRRSRNCARSCDFPTQANGISRSAMEAQGDSHAISVEQRQTRGLALMAAGSVNAHAYQLVGLWESYNAGVNDTFYTIDWAQYLVSLGSPNNSVTHGVAAFLPCAPNTMAGPHGETPAAPAAADLGYGGGGPFTCPSPGASALPFYRYYKYLPETDHFYTTDPTEVTTGYTFERAEGYLFTTQVSGSVPLYRLSRCVAVSGGCDKEHRYTVSLDTKNILVSAGWTFDKIAGYAFTEYTPTSTAATYSGTLNGVTGGGTSPVSVPIRNVSPPTAQFPVSGTGRTNFNGQFISNTTGRPTGASQQRVSFSFYTGNLFASTNNFTHYPVWLYGTNEFFPDGLPGEPKDGFGIFFAVPNAVGGLCGSGTTGGQVFVERYSAFSNAISCANMSTPMQANRWYDVTLTVSDAAQLSYTVKDTVTLQTYSFTNNYASLFSCPISPAPGTLPAAKGYCNNPVTGDHFSRQRTGYYLGGVWNNASPFGTGAIKLIKVQWLDAAGNVLFTQ